MCIERVFALILACSVAFPVLAQPAGTSVDTNLQVAPTASTSANGKLGPSPVQAKPENPEAAAALAVAIRQAQAQDRLLQMACNAGDTSKCQPANASTSAKGSLQ